MSPAARRIAPLAGALLFPATRLMACPVCYGDPANPMTHGMNSAILLLLGVVGFVQLGFVAMFLVWWRNGKRLKHEGVDAFEGGTL